MSNCLPSCVPEPLEPRQLYLAQLQLRNVRRILQAEQHLEQWAPAPVTGLYHRIHYLFKRHFLVAICFQRGLFYF